jgi:hypothetical protein
MTPEYKSFLTELYALLYFMGTSPENRESVLRDFGKRNESIDTKEQELYRAFLNVKARITRSNEKARMIFRALQREGENAKWKTSFPSEVEERVISFLKPRGGLRSMHGRITKRHKKGTKRRIMKRRKQTRKYHK